MMQGIPSDTRGGEVMSKEQLREYGEYHHRDMNTAVKYGNGVRVMMYNTPSVPYFDGIRDGRCTCILQPDDAAL